MLESLNFFAQTRMRIEIIEFEDVIQNASDFTEDERRTLKIVSSSSGVKLMTVNLIIYRRFFSKRNAFNNWEIEIIPMENQSEIAVFFKLIVIYFSGNTSELGVSKKAFTLKSLLKFPLPSISKRFLMKKEENGVKNDSLSLRFKLAVCSGIEYEKVEMADSEMDSTVGVKETDFLNSLEILTSKDEVPCDTKLQTATETFPAHTTVLSSQSPVFEAMFQTDMKETVQKCVLIEDIDTETVYHMLVFLYSDTLEKLDWKDTMKLYCAADKYQIDSLKKICIDFLKQIIDLSNCCVLLHVSDMYQDEDLKRAAQEYITKNIKNVLYCDQWRDVEKSLPHLAIDYFRELCQRNKLL